MVKRPNTTKKTTNKWATQILLSKGWYRRPRKCQHSLSMHFTHHVT
jgi:hypothetical protein